MKEVFINGCSITNGNRNARSRPLFKLVKLYALIKAEGVVLEATGIRQIYFVALFATKYI